MKITIFLDMDGVVSDAHSAFLKQLGREDLIPVEKYPAGVWDISEVLDISDEEFWARIGERGYRLWSEMDELPWARYLYKRLQQMATVVFLSSPSQDPESVKGKLIWLQRFTGDRSFRSYAFSHEKQEFASTGKLLIDDSEKNCEKFHKAGGLAVQFPARWQGRSDDEIQDSLPELLDVVARQVDMLKRAGGTL